MLPDLLCYSSLIVAPFAFYILVFSSSSAFHGLPAEGSLHPTIASTHGQDLLRFDSCPLHPSTSTQGRYRLDSKPAARTTSCTSLPQQHCKTPRNRRAGIYTHTVNLPPVAAPGLTTAPPSNHRRHVALLPTPTPPSLRRRQAHPSRLLVVHNLRLRHHSLPRVRALCSVRRALHRRQNRIRV